MIHRSYTLFLIATILLFTSCSVFRGFSLDGFSGPDIYEYQKLERDTIRKGSNVFHFPLVESHRKIRGDFRLKYKGSERMRLDSLVEQWFGKDNQLFIMIALFMTNGQSHFIQERMQLSSPCPSL